MIRLHRSVVQISRILVTAQPPFRWWPEQFDKTTHGLRFAGISARRHTLPDFALSRIRRIHYETPARDPVCLCDASVGLRRGNSADSRAHLRSEEHTSELQ